MNSRTKKFLSYYKPYLGLLFADLACAFVVSAITLTLPLCIRYITINVLEGNSQSQLIQIYAVGAVMLAMVIIHTLCDMFISYKGHMMGAYMESDMRRELFDHFQKLSFGFYDEHKTGQLMTRTTNDILSLTELYHHGPEDIVISVLKFLGAFIILMYIDVKLTLIVFLFLPVMAAFAFYYNKKMNAALRVSKDRIEDINAQVEDSLSGIRVVKSFTNEHIEKGKFAYANKRFVDSRREGYKSETYFHEGLVGFTQLITITVIVFGGAAIVEASLELADLLTFFLCIGILIEPIQRMVNFARLYQEGITGFDRFMEILEVEPDIEDADFAETITQAISGRLRSTL